MITKINTNIPTQTNKRIIQTLFKTTFWGFAKDNELSHDLNKSNQGLAMVTFQDENIPYSPNEILNTYAGIIFDMVQKDSFIKFKKIKRLYWNWYDQTSQGMAYHIDDPADNKYSIIYNLHTNDGGTNFKINDEIKFEKSTESEAIVFPSKIWHSGVAPTKDLHRFNLNIITEI